jgi:isoamylase
MLLGGDEFGRTQGGNNNAYCHDDEISWFDWSMAGANQDLVDFTKALARLRIDHPVFRRPKFFQGRPLHGSGRKDIGWFRPEGTEMSHQDWAEPVANSIAVYLNGDALGAVDEQGEPVSDDTFLLLLNARDKPVDFTLPGPDWGPSWTTVLDTATGQCTEGEHQLLAGQRRSLPERSLVLLRRVGP